MKLPFLKPKTKSQNPEDATGLTVIIHPNDILSRISAPCDLFLGRGQDHVDFGKKMLAWALAYNSVSFRRQRCAGLAAPQVGVNRRVFVMVPEMKAIAGPDTDVCINPKIVRHGNRQTAELEGCFSVPGKNFYVTRWDVIEVEYWNADCQLVSKQLKYWEARIFQHELDHLDGILCCQKG